MILLCDEDVGTGVPRALDLVGHEAKSLNSLGWGGKPDIEWLGRAGPKGWLVFSFNKKMLLVPNEKQTIISAKVGIVFLTHGGISPPAVLRMILGKWPALELLDKTTQRPFARFITMNGRISEKYRHYRL